MSQNLQICHACNIVTWPKVENSVNMTRAKVLCSRKLNICSQLISPDAVIQNLESDKIFAWLRLSANTEMHFASSKSRCLDMQNVRNSISLESRACKRKCVFLKWSESDRILKAVGVCWLLPEAVVGSEWCLNVNQQEQVFLFSLHPPPS